MISKQNDIIVNRRRRAEEKQKRNALTFDPFELEAVVVFIREGKPFRIFAPSDFEVVVVFHFNRSIARHPACV